MGPTQFLGEISLLNGGNWSMAMRAVRDTRVLEVPREAVLTLMRLPFRFQRCPTLSSRCFRRAAAVRLRNRISSLRLIGEDDDRNVRRIGGICEP